MSFRVHLLSPVLACVISSLAAAPIIAAPAVRAEVQRAQSAPVFHMPAGDLYNSDLVAPFQIQQVPPRLPISEERLRDEKALSAAGSMSSVGGKPVELIERLNVTPENEEFDMAPTSIDASDVAPSPSFASAACSTNIATGFAPSDIHGAAGAKVLVVVTNVDIGVYSKSTCALISRVPLKTFFGTFPDIDSQTLISPRVIYDRTKGLFFVTAASTPSGATGTDQYQYFAVSTTASAVSWHRFRIALSAGPSVRFCKRQLTSVWDYPVAGKNAKRWFITANDSLGSADMRGAVLVIDKAPTLTGVSPAVKCFSNLPYNISPPVVLDGNVGQSVFLAPRSDRLLRYNHASGSNVPGDTLVTGPAYPIATWGLAPDAVQPNAQRLDTLDGRFQGPSIQSRDRVWNIHTVASGGGPAIRWYRLKRTASTTLSTHTFTSGHLFNPSFTTGSGIDGAPAFITASRTIPSCTTQSCRASMLTFSGPNSTSSGWTATLAGTSSNNFMTTDGTMACNASARGACLWGSYSAISVDPNEAGTAWGFNQLINGFTQFDWGTKGVRETYNLQN